jgi:hypothetical protein
MTFAPFARQPSACDFWRAALACALTTCAGIFAALNALVRYGASKSVYRVDDFVSGSRAHTLMPAELLATVAAAELTTVSVRNAMSSPAPHRDLSFISPSVGL